MIVCDHSPVYLLMLEYCYTLGIITSRASGQHQLGGERCPTRLKMLSSLRLLCLFTSSLCHCTLRYSGSHHEQISSPVGRPGNKSSPTRNLAWISKSDCKKRKQKSNSGHSLFSLYNISIWFWLRKYINNDVFYITFTFRCAKRTSIMYKYVIWLKHFQVCPPRRVTEHLHCT